MAKKKKPGPPPTAQRFYESFDAKRRAVWDAWIGATPSDHAFALVTAAMLDNALKEGIRRVLVGPENIKEKLLGTDGSLGTFSSRINTGLALGLYGQKTHRDLDIIREIRNTFAHYPTLHNPHRKHEVVSFRHNTVANLCQALTTPEYFKLTPVATFLNGVMSYDSSATQLTVRFTDPRERFNFTAIAIIGFILFNDDADCPRIVVCEKLP